MAITTAKANKSISPRTVNMIRAFEDRESVQTAINKIKAIIANSAAATIIKAMKCLYDFLA
jgi:hypothetical protein